MRLSSYSPGPPLDAFVDAMWLHESGPGPGTSKERVLPTGQMQMIINLHDNRFSNFVGENEELGEDLPGAIISGTWSGYVTIDASELVSVMGVSFKAGGSFPFLGAKAGELRDVDAPLEALWGRDARDLRSRLIEAPTPAQKFRILESYLLEKADRPLETHRAVGYALDAFKRVPHGRTIAEVTEQVGLSARRFIEVFDEYVGLTPKLFCRVHRFQQVLRRVHTAKEVSWAEVANDCGYFDQAHFIRDFKAFSGINPTAYLKVRGEYQNHIPSPA
jgi:AraC-like DNA-binding protein